LRQGGDPGLYQASGFNETGVLGTTFAVDNYNSGATTYPVPIQVCIAQVYFTQ
jgi:hypothetical protein